MNIKAARQAAMRQAKSAGYTLENLAFYLEQEVARSGQPGIQVTASMLSAIKQRGGQHSPILPFLDAWLQVNEFWPPEAPAKPHESARYTGVRLVDAPEMLRRLAQDVVGKEGEDVVVDLIQHASDVDSLISLLEYLEKKKAEPCGEAD